MAELYQAKKPNLGFGNMRMPRRADGSPDVDTIFRMVDTFLAHGYSYFDTAYIYPGSEEMLRTALVERYPRDRYQITSKAFLGDCKTPDDMIKQFNTSRERLGLEMIDTYFLHGLSGETIKKAREFGAFDILRRLRSEGLIQHFGFSFHGTPEQLDELLTEQPDTELVQLQLNYLDWENEKVQSRRCYETARKHNVPISVMEPCKGGLLAGEDNDAAHILMAANPDETTASWAFRYIAELEGIHVILSGMSNVEQVVDNARTFENFRPLTAEEHALLDRVVEKINSIPGVPCTSCGYCSSGCPQEIRIPFFMSQYNSLIRFNNEEIAKHVYFMATQAQPKASECIGCRSCEDRCPQHIEITKYLQVLVDRLEN